AVERHSQHPLADAVVRRAEAEGLALPDVGDVTSLTARGIRSTVEGERLDVGNLRLWEEQDVPLPPSVTTAVRRLQERGQSTMVVRLGARWMGVVGVADAPRPGVREM